MSLWLILISLFAACLSANAFAQTDQSRNSRRAANINNVSVDDVNAAAAEFATAQGLEASGSNQQAILAYHHIHKTYPFTPHAGEALFRLAEIYQAAGELKKAFNTFSIFIRQHPDSNKFEQAIAAQVTIANQYLDGRKRRLLGIPIESGYSEAEKMYTSILADAPFSKFAPMTQFNLGLAYEKQGKADLAQAAYQTVLDKYPSSSVCDDALYQIGYLYMRIGFANGSQDLSALITAKNTFEDFLAQYPNSEKVPQATENLVRIASREATDLLTIAKFYDRHKDYKSAVIYYNDIIRQQSTGEQADYAKSRIEVLRGEYGDEALRGGPERTDNSERVALRRRLQTQVENSALSNYNGPTRQEIINEELPVARSQLRTGMRDVDPLPAIEPSLPADPE